MRYEDRNCKDPDAIWQEVQIVIYNHYLQTGIEIAWLAPITADLGGHIRLFFK